MHCDVRKYLSDVKGDKDGWRGLKKMIEGRTSRSDRAAPTALRRVGIRRERSGTRASVRL